MLRQKPIRNIRNVRHACWLADRGWQIFGLVVCRFEGKANYRLDLRIHRALVNRGWISYDGGVHWTYRWRKGRGD